MGLPKIDFKILKSTDMLILTSVEKALKESNLKLQSLSMNLSLGGGEKSFQNFEIIKDNDFKTILKQNSELIQNFRFNIIWNDKGSIFTFQITRQLNHNFDNCTLNFEGVEESFRTSAAILLGNLRNKLKAFDSEQSIKAHLGDTLNVHYQAREAGLNKIESIAENLIANQEIYQQKLDKKFETREEERRQELENEKKKLKEKEEALNARLKEIDDRAAKHARRDLRSSLKDIYHQRGQKFELSSGTINLRNPINYLSIGMILFFAVLFSLALLNSLGIIGTISETSLWILYGRQLFLAVALGASIIFYIRWNSTWFERHAREEFLLKRQEIDVDRASWAVELAFEWHDEKKVEIPEELLKTLTKNLFEYEKTQDPVLHPADELASAILGVSARTKIKMPNGTEMELDRKSVKDLEKMNQ